MPVPGTTVHWTRADVAAVWSPAFGYRLLSSRLLSGAVPSAPKHPAPSALLVYTQLLHGPGNVGATQPGASAPRRRLLIATLAAVSPEYDVPATPLRAAVARKL